METNVYNVIWADDDIDSYRDDQDALDILDSHHVKIIDWAHTSNELREKLDEWGDKVDAVITDGNFDKKKMVGVGNSTSGLSDVLSFINEYNKRRFIPFFLYTGKGNILKDKYPDGELDYFRNMGRYFEKGNFSKLLIKLKADVDHINSDPFRIRNKYAKEFEAAKLIEDAERNLEKGLLYQYNDGWKDVQDYFTPARKIIERVFHKLKQQKILPPISKLNSMGRLLIEKKYEDEDCFFEIKKDIMPSPLAHSLRFFLDITQDGSHDNGDIVLGVDSYIRSSHNTNLFNSILSIAMDLLLWYKDISTMTDSVDDIWTGSFKFEYIGKLCMSPDGRYWYAGEYEIKTNPEFYDGAKIGIRRSTQNKKSRPGINKFVNQGCYTLLEE